MELDYTRKEQYLALMSFTPLAEDEEAVLAERRLELKEMKDDRLKWLGERIRSSF